MEKILRRSRTRRAVTHRRTAMLETYTMARFRDALRSLAAFRSLRTKLPRNAVAWQRQIRKGWDRAHRWPPVASRSS